MDEILGPISFHSIRKGLYTQMIQMNSSRQKQNKNREGLNVGDGTVVAFEADPMNTREFLYVTLPHVLETQENKGGCSQHWFLVCMKKNG